MRLARLVVVGIAAFGGASAFAADTIGWQEAVARLAQERTRATTCVALLKKYGDASAKARGEAAYGDAEAEYDGVVAGLVVALEQGKEPASLPDLEARLQRGFDKREALCKGVQALLPPPKTGEKGSPWGDIAEGAIGPIVDAVKEIYLRHLSDAESRRATIKTQLEDTKWPPFASVPPSSSS